jgi:uncharacterized protein YjbI with pentapeptide repeats
MAPDKKQADHIPIKDTDWYAILNLIIVPILLLLLTIGFSLFQADQEDKIEATRQSVQSTVEAGRIQDNLLQAYFDDMTSIMSDSQFPNVQYSCASLGVEAIPEVSGSLISIAQARTEVVITQLSRKRLGSVIRFLSETQLMGAMLKCELINLDLQEADLDRTNLAGLIFGASNLRGANLGGVNLQEAFLEGAELQGAFLVRARLEDSVLFYAKLQHANLFDACLQGAFLGGADLTGASLTNANFSGTILDESTILPDGSLWTPEVDLTQFGVSLAPPNAGQLDTCALPVDD